MHAWKHFISVLVFFCSNNLQNNKAQSQIALSGGIQRMKYLNVSDSVAFSDAAFGNQHSKDALTTYCNIDNVRTHTRWTTCLFWGSTGNFSHSNVINNSQFTSDNGLIYSFQRSFMRVIHCSIVDSKGPGSVFYTESAKMEIIDCYVNPIKYKGYGFVTESISNNSIENSLDVYSCQLDCDYNSPEDTHMMSKYNLCLDIMMETVFILYR